MEKGKVIGKFWYSRLIPKEVLPEIQELTSKYEWLVPAWCSQVRVHWSEDSSQSDGMSFSATTHTLYQYRCAHLTIAAAWFGEEPEERELTIKHEISHIILAPLISFFRDSIDAFEPDEHSPARILFDRNLYERHESVTEDLAQAIDKGQKSNFFKKSKRLKK